jgi:hypothetical protein
LSANAAFQTASIISIGRSPRRGRASIISWSIRAKLLADLAPGGRDHHYVTLGGTWFKHVEEHIAIRDGNAERAAALQAEAKNEGVRGLRRSAMRGQGARLV